MSKPYVPYGTKRYIYIYIYIERERERERERKKLSTLIFIFVNRLKPFPWMQLRKREEIGFKKVYTSQDFSYWTHWFEILKGIVKQISKLISEQTNQVYK